MLKIFIDYELFSQESRKRKFIPVINHPDIGDEVLKDDVRWKLAKNPGINTWTAVAKTWSQYDNAMDAKCMSIFFILKVSNKFCWQYIYIIKV